MRLQGWIAKQQIDILLSSIIAKAAYQLSNDTNTKAKMGKKGGGRVRVVQKGPKMPPNPMADFAIPPGECPTSVYCLSLISIYLLILC